MVDPFNEVRLLNIGIVGPGAIGMLFGYYLAEAGHNITFYMRRKNVNELTIQKLDGSRERLNCHIAYEIEELKQMDLVIIAVKYHHLSSIKKGLDQLPEDLPLLFIQNGLMHLTYIESLKQRTIILGSVLHGAAKEDAATVHHTGVGTTTIGLYRGSWQLLDDLLQSQSEYFPLQQSSEMEQILFKKALLNCLINPLTAIAGVPNGALITNPSYHTIMKNIYCELIQAFPEWKEKLAFQEVEELCKNTAQNRSSMLKDLENGRFMEVETIVGAVLQRAAVREKQLPILHTFYLLLTERNVGDSYN